MTKRITWANICTRITIKKDTFPQHFVTTNTFEKAEHQESQHGKIYNTDNMKSFHAYKKMVYNVARIPREISEKGHIVCYLLQPSIPISSKVTFKSVDFFFVKRKKIFLLYLYCVCVSVCVVFQFNSKQTQTTCAWSPRVASHKKTTINFKTFWQGEIVMRYLTVSSSISN